MHCADAPIEVKVVTASDLFNSIIVTNSSSLILLNIWSTSCIPCIQEFPYIVNLKKKYDINDLNIVFLSTDWDENADEVKDFLISQKVSGIHYRKKEGNDQKFIDQISPYWTGALPFTGIYDNDLNLISFWEGKKEESYFINKIDSLLKLKGELL